MKLDLLTNATVVDDAITFVASEESKDKEREQVKSSPSSSARAAMKTTTRNLRSLIIMKTKGHTKKEKKSKNMTRRK